MSQKYALTLVKELNELQYKTGYNSDIDEEILGIVAKVPNVSLVDLAKKRVEMWLSYTQLLLDEINRLIKNLLKNFAEVKDINKRFKKLVRRYEKINKEYISKISKINLKNIEEVKKLFKDAHELFIDIRDDEKVLILNGRIKFFTKIYPVYGTLVSTAYSIIISILNTAEKIDITRHLGYVVIGWIFVLGAVYYLIRWFLRKGIEEKEED